MNDNNMIQETFQFPTSPGQKSSIDDQSTSPIDNGRNSYSFAGAESETYLHTPRNDEAPHPSMTAATLSPQSQSSPPESSQRPRKATSITPILHRGRVLQDDEIAGTSAGNSNDDPQYHRFVRATPPREYGSTPTDNSQSFIRYQPDLSTSPNTAIHQNRIMTQHLQHQPRMIDPSYSYSDSPDQMGGSNHNVNETSNVSVSMLWGNDMGGVHHPGEKPKRPLSAYNFYFQLERERIINSSDEDRELNVIYTVDDVARLTLTQQRKAKENKPKEKRSHRKTHGKISFGDLARTIANKWKQLDKTAKEIFEGSASIEKDRYRKELGEWNKQMKKWKDAAAKVASTLQYSQKGGLSSTSNHSHQDSNTSGHLTFNSGNHMVTPEVPKRAVYHSGDIHEDSPTDHHMIHALGNQQRAMHSNDPLGKGSLSSRSSSSHVTLQQHNKSHRAAALSSVLQQHGAGMLPAGSNLSNRFNGLRSSILPQTGLGRSNGVGLGLLDYGDDVGQPFGLNDALGDDEYNINDGFSHTGGANGNNGYDFDDVTDETYRMAQMMLPPQNMLAQRNMAINGNVGGGALQQQRRLFNQRRMKMLMMMQQKYNRDQMLMMQMGQYNGHDAENYEASLDDPQQQYMDHLDDAASYIDPSTAANHLMMNQATAAAAAAFGRSQQHRHLLQQHQNRLVDELNASQHSGLDDQYLPMAHMLHSDSFDDRA